MKKPPLGHQPYLHFGTGDVPFHFGEKILNVFHVVSSTHNNRILHIKGTVRTDLVQVLLAGYCLQDACNFCRNSAAVLCQILGITRITTN